MRGYNLYCAVGSHNLLSGSCLRLYSDGVQLLDCLKILLNVDILEKPTESDISVIERSGLASRSEAALILRYVKYSLNVKLVYCLNNLEKWNLLKPD